jgi:hypothetical protein
MENNLQSLLDGAITPWVAPTVGPSIVPARWEWTSFDLPKSQNYSGVVKELMWEIDKLAVAKIDIGGKVHDVMLGFPVRMDFRGIAREDVAPGITLAFQAVPSKQSPTDLRVEILTIGKTSRDMR